MMPKCDDCNNLRFDGAGDPYCGSSHRETQRLIWRPLNEDVYCFAFVSKKTKPADDEKKERVEIRKSRRPKEEDDWVVDIVYRGKTDGYIHPDGSAGDYITYEVRDCAVRARDLYLGKNGEKSKGSNPKEALGVRKVPLHNIPCGPEFELGIVFLSGALKYGSHNYRDTNILASVYYDAIMRHVKAWQEGEDFDPDSGMHHLIHAAACCFVARDSMLMGKFEDDRPLKYPNGLNMAELNKKAAKLIEGCSEPAKPFTQKDRE